MGIMACGWVGFGPQVERTDRERSASGVGAARECVRRLADTYGDTHAAVLVAWLLGWGRAGRPACTAADEALVRDWQAFQVRSVGRPWTFALAPVADGLPLTALALERFLGAVYLLLDDRET